MPHPPAPRTIGALLAAGLVGGLFAVQAQLNSELADELGGGIAGAADAALVSFGGGFALLCLVVALAARHRRGLRRVLTAALSGRLRWWQLVGGTSGALVVASQSITVGTIGVALFIVALVAGQTSSALLVDKVGAGPGGRRAVTASRAAGAVLAVVAVVLAVSDRLGGAAVLAPAALLLAALPLLSGGLTAWQQAFNGQISVVGGPFAAAWVNFLVGTVVLAIFALAALGEAGSVSIPPAPWSSQWWLYAGGAIGVVFISAAAVLVRVLGVLVFGLCTVAGQVITAVLVDLVVANVRMGVLTVGGAVLTLAGVGVAAGSGRWTGRGTPADRAADGDDGDETPKPARSSTPPT